MFVPSKREPMGGRECEERHLKNNKTIRHRQHEFTEGNLCSSHLVCFYKKVSCVVGEGKGVDVFWVIVRLLILLSFIVSSWGSCPAVGWAGSRCAGWRTGWMAGLKRDHTDWRPFLSDVPQRSSLGSGLFHVLISALHAGGECTCAGFSWGTANFLHSG